MIYYSIPSKVESRVYLFPFMRTSPIFTIFYKKIWKEKKEKDALPTSITYLISRKEKQPERNIKKFLENDCFLGN